MKKTLGYMVLLTGLWIGPGGWAQEGEAFLEMTERRNRYTVEAVDVPLGQVTQRLKELSGVELTLASGLESRRVNLSLKKAKLDELIKALTGGHVLNYKLVDGEYRISSGSLMDSYQQKLTENKLSRRERRDQERMVGEVRKVIEQINTVHGYAGQLNYDEAKALIEQRKSKIDAYVEELAGLGPGGARAVMEVFGSAGSLRGRLAMIQALGRMQDPGASEALGAVFAASKSFSEQEEAVRTLSRRGDGGAKDALEHIVSSETDLRLRVKAVMGLSGHASAVPVLGDLASSETENSNVRCEAIRALGAIGNAGAANAVAQAARDAQNPNVKQVAVKEMTRSFGRQ